MSDGNADDRTPILEFEDVSLEVRDGYDHGVRNVSFSLRAGECCLIRVEWESVRSPLADLAGGVIDPDTGIVRFNGQDWRRAGFGQSARDRGRIGRTFEGVGWVANLDVDENIILAERHHTWRGDKELLAEAESLAKDFGLQPLPQSRPSKTRRQDLARAALVRAFMGSPKLLVLERPELNAYPDIMPALLKQLSLARQRGAAILWMTNRPEIWQEPEARPTLRFAMAGETLVPTT